MPIEPPTELDAEIAPALAGQVARALELHLALCEAAKKLGVTPKLPDLVSLSDEAFEQVAALLELCKAGELAAPVKPIETEADCALLDGVELPEQVREGRLLVTERNPAELFGSTSDHYLLVRHLGPFTLADGQEPVREGGRVRFKLKTVEGAQVVYRLQTPEEASRPVTLPDSSTAA